MTERKPAGVPYETWIDTRIRQAQERGEFDNLPGAGKPLRWDGDPDDEHWWIKGYVRREGLPTEALLPEPLRLRKEVERLPETVARLRTEAAVRDLVAGLNKRISDWLLVPTGPQVALSRVDPDEVVAGWHAHRAASAPPKPVAAAAGPVRVARRRWWQWRRIS